ARSIAFTIPPNAGERSGKSRRDVFRLWSRALCPPYLRSTYLRHGLGSTPGGRGADVVDGGGWPNRGVREYPQAATELPEMEREEKNPRAGGGMARSGARIPAARAREVHAHVAHCRG